MGWGTLLILITHAYGNNVKMSPLIERFVDNCQIGVDLFLLLSGIGIAFSLQKTINRRRFTKLKSWYYQRLKRIYVPFALIIFLYYLYVVPFEGRSIWTAVLDIANIGWWINGKGTWYVSLILLLYLVAPLLYNVYNIQLWYNAKYKWLSLTLSCFAVWCIFQDDPNSSLHYVANAIKRSPSFFIGIALAPLVRLEYRINLPLLLLISIVLFVLASLALPLGFCKWLLILPISLVLVCIIEKIQLLRVPLCFLGVISLESYLTNITLGDILNHKSWIIFGIDLSYGHYLEYTVVLVVGVLLAWAFNRVSNRILRRI